tara:strand:+ start:323 stop:658 length:336 start_codon:yes stop_codon:yes gene_type:complete
MDLKKLDPMARKMRTHMDAFYKALEDNDGFSARSHIGEVMKYADYLSNDIESAVIKNDKTVGINDTYVSGVPVRKFNKTEKVHASSSDVLPGTIRTNRIGNIMRQQSNRTL